MQLNESKWASELSGLQDSQKREYVDWVMCVHEDTQAMQGTPSYMYARAPPSFTQNVFPSYVFSNKHSCFGYQSNKRTGYNTFLPATLK